jgi:hypothetical protein
VKLDIQCVACELAEKVTAKNILFTNIGTRKPLNLLVDVSKSLNEHKTTVCFLQHPCRKALYIYSFFSFFSLPENDCDVFDNDVRLSQDAIMNNSACPHGSDAGHSIKCLCKSVYVH